VYFVIFFIFKNQQNALITRR